MKRTRFSTGRPVPGVRPRQRGALCGGDRVNAVMFRGYLIQSAAVVKASPRLRASPIRSGSTSAVGGSMGVVLRVRVPEDNALSCLPQAPELPGGHLPLGRAKQGRPPAQDFREEVPGLPYFGEQLPGCCRARLGMVEGVVPYHVSL